MTSTEKILKFLDELSALEERATKCSACCSPVIHHRSNDGTQYYESIGEKRMRPMIRMLRELVEVCRNTGQQLGYDVNRIGYSYEFAKVIVFEMQHESTVALERAAKEVPE